MSGMRKLNRGKRRRVPVPATKTITGLHMDVTAYGTHGGVRLVEPRRRWVVPGEVWPDAPETCVSGGRRVLARHVAEGSTCCPFCGLDTSGPQDGPAGVPSPRRP